jgi:hypothetical protein
MPLELIKNQRGRDIFIYNGFIHKQERTIEDKIILKCNEKKNVLVELIQFKVR